MAARGVCCGQTGSQSRRVQKPISHHEGVFALSSYSAPGGWPLAACRGTWCRCTGSTVSQLVLCCVTRSTKHTSRGARICCFSSRLDYPVQLMCPTPWSRPLFLSHTLPHAAHLPARRRNMWSPCSRDWKRRNRRNGLGTGGPPSHSTSPKKNVFAEDTYSPPCRCYSCLCTTFSIGARRTKFGTTVYGIWHSGRSEEPADADEERTMSVTVLCQRCSGARHND